MKAFTELIRNIKAATVPSDKIEAIVQFLHKAKDEDKIWGIALLTKKRPKKRVTLKHLRAWAIEEAGIGEWLFEECYRMVGDLSETIALVLPLNTSESDNNLDQWIRLGDQLKGQTENFIKESVIVAWKKLKRDEHILFNKIITGGFRIGVSDRIITKALTEYLHVDENIIAHRLMGNWDPFAISFRELLLVANENEINSKPYPFYYTYDLAEELGQLGSSDEWVAEWKWNGLRSQLIKRNKEVFIWSKNEEYLNGYFPEFQTLNETDAPSFVLDGMLVILKEDAIQDFNVLNKRLGKKKPTKKLRNEFPAIIIAFDILELNGEDLRHLPQGQRRMKLENFIESLNERQIHSELPITISPLIEFRSWEELAHKRTKAREIKSEGVMLKSIRGPYKLAREKGDWWKWKLDPMTILAVLIYAHRIQGGRSASITDFTFALWNGDQLVPITKAFEGLSSIEHNEIKSFVKQNTLERFGPVSSVEASLVFEISFDGIASSKRHKSGVILRNPSINRWLKDMEAKEANKINELKLLL